MPKSNEEQFVPADKFSVDRAMTPLLEITKKPHFLGSDAHSEVQQFLISEIQKLGLSPHIQEGYNYNPKSKVFTRPSNIVARIPGTEEEGKALLLLSHYDSAAVASFGAADDASGIVTILESVRAFLSTGNKPKNDIIILFTDSEEISLDGAQLFVNEHPWVKNIGLVLNFEARGTGGPSNMILETNQGNSKLIKAFVEANPKFPVASSLMYSVYKLLPNDTDSTVFREVADIDSFFFAFIDEHYNYHTANDAYYNLDRNSLAHQGSYLLPLLHYFSESDLSSLKSEKEHVYFNFPLIKIVHYPFSWIFPILIITTILFLLITFYGISSRNLDLRIIIKGFVPLIGALLITGFFGFFGWKLIQLLYPNYNEIQQGFTYNGHWYIAFFVAVSLSFCFLFYRKKYKKQELSSLFVAPLFFWLIINYVIAVYLKGAAFFIIPVFFGLISFIYLLFKKEANLLFLSILTIPAIFIFAPLIQFFPVGLGLKMIVISCVFTTLLFVLILPVFGFYRRKNSLAILCILASVFFFIKAHSKSSFTENRKKPNSLVYYEDTDKQKSYWLTFDKKLDEWTKQYLGDSLQSASNFIDSASYSKYGINYTYGAKSNFRSFKKSDIILRRDSVIDQKREIIFTIMPERNIHKIEMYSYQTNEFQDVEFNGVQAKHSEVSTYRGEKNPVFVHYYLNNRDSLQVKISTEIHTNPNFKILEYSFDLMSNEELQVIERPKNMMPKPFVLNDAIIIKHDLFIDSLKLDSKDSLELNKN